MDQPEHEADHGEAADVLEPGLDQAEEVAVGDRVGFDFHHAQQRGRAVHRLIPWECQWSLVIGHWSLGRRISPVDADDLGTILMTNDQ